MASSYSFFSLNSLIILQNSHHDPAVWVFDFTSLLPLTQNEFSHIAIKDHMIYALGDNDGLDSGVIVEKHFFHRIPRFYRLDAIAFRSSFARITSHGMGFPIRGDDLHL